MSEPFEPTAHAAYPGLSLRRPWTPAPLSAYRVIAFDMDSTLVAIETLDEMAALMGRGAEVAAITEAAMRGEISDYKQSLRERWRCLPACRRRWRTRSMTNASPSTLAPRN